MVSKLVYTERPAVQKHRRVYAVCQIFKTGVPGGGDDVDIGAAVFSASDLAIFFSPLLVFPHSSSNKPRHSEAHPSPRLSSTNRFAPCLYPLHGLPNAWQWGLTLLTTPRIPTYLFTMIPCLKSRKAVATFPIIQTIRMTM